MKARAAGLAAYTGKTITIYCLNYIYTGNVAAVTDEEVELDQAAIVYETGELKASKFSDAQELPSKHCVRISAIESYGAGK
jgi:hypothetical protein